MRRLAVCLSIAVLAAAVGGPHAALADKEKWDVYIGGGEAIMFYGIPESDIGTLNINCEPKRKRITFVSSVVPPKPRVGAAVKIKLTNGGKRLEYDGKIGRDRGHETFHAAGPVAFDGKLFGFLGAGSRLTLEVAGARSNVPLRGIGKPLAQMRQACLGKA